MSLKCPENRGRLCRISRSYKMTSISGRSILPSLHVLTLALALFFTASESEFTSCDIDTVENEQAAILICFFSNDMQESHSDLFVQCFNQTGFIEDSLNCVWKQGSYKCTVNNGLLSLNSSNVSNFLMVRMAPVSVQTVGLSCLCRTSDDFAVPGGCGFPEAVVPEAPTLQVVSSSSSSIEVSWKSGRDRRSAVLGFELNYTRGKDDWQTVHLGPGNTTYVATGLLCGTLYHFAVRAFNAVGNSSYSLLLPARTNGSAPVMPSQNRLLKEINVTTVTLDFIGWRSDGCPIKFFCVTHRRLNDTNSSFENHNISSYVREMTVAELAPGSEYLMTVTAHSDAGETFCRLQFTTLPQPPPLTTSTGTKDESTNTAMIVPVIVLSVLLVVVLVMSIYCYRKRHTRRRRSDGPISTWSLQDTQMD